MEFSYVIIFFIIIYIDLLYVNWNFILDAARFIHIFMFLLLLYTSNKYIYMWVDKAL